MLIWLFTTLIACGGGGSTAVVAKAPATAKGAAVVCVAPADRADQVAVSSTITATFDSDMDPASLNAETFKVSGPDGAISGIVAYDSTTQTVIFTPIAPLMPLSSYTATFTSGIRNQKGSVWTEDYTWTFKTTKDVMERSASDKVPDGLFSLNVINLEWGATWPTIPFKAWRNFHSAWAKLEKQHGAWDFTLLDGDVALAGQKGVELMLVLTGTPLWASARPEDGTRAEAANIEDWKNYVRTVATRYKGQVHHYELWNEPDQKNSYSGTVDKLVDLCRAAYQVLKEVDPTIIVVSPAMTSSNMTNLDNYLAAQGGTYADVISYHFYVAPKSPETMLDKIQKVRGLMAKYNINKPLWNSETGWRILNSDKNIKDQQWEWAGPAISDDGGAAYIARSYIISWVAGVDRLFWYAWGHQETGLTEYDLQTPKKSAIAYAEVQRWLIGNKVISCGQNADSAWFVQIGRESGYKAWIVWKSEGNIFLALPKEWKAKQMRDLSGNKTSLSESSRISIGTTPILIES